MTALALALRFSLEGGKEPQAQLVSYLRDKQVLLVLDNLEHLLSEATRVAELLWRAPNVRAIVTSRERLNVQGEWLCDVSGLSYQSGGPKR